ncbi:MAG TPA: hypothetical protein VN613_09475 [Gemmatimonadaceae bacterium]|nr:hypothetical protein [Gemmatimonadaceae bacterium]
MIDDLTSDLTNDPAETTLPELLPLPPSPPSAEYAVHGAVASYSIGHGWTSSDALVAKHLNRLAAVEYPDGATVANADTLITREYGIAARRIGVVGPDTPAHDHANEHANEHAGE